MIDNMPDKIYAYPFNKSASGGAWVVSAVLQLDPDSRTVAYVRQDILDELVMDAITKNFDNPVIISNKKDYE